jgi:hypothetical protein
LTATFSPTPTTTSTSVSAPPATATPEASDSHSPTLSTGAIAGIAIGKPQPNTPARRSVPVSISPPL